jgi:hypothetical protein
MDGSTGDLRPIFYESPRTDSRVIVYFFPVQFLILEIINNNMDEQFWHTADPVIKISSK